MSKSAYSSSKLVKIKKRKRIIKLILLLIFFIAFIYGISFLSWHQSIQINEVKVESNQYVDSGFIKNIADQKRRGKLLFIFSKNNFIFLPRQEIRKEIANNLAIKSLKLDVNGFKTLNIKIEEHIPVAKWCDGPSCFYVNDQGLAFVVAKAFSGEEMVILRREGENKTPEIGWRFVEPEIFKKLYLLTELLKQINIKTVEIKTEDLETFVLKTQGGPDLMVEKGDDPVEVVTNLNTIMERDAINEIQFRNIEYIDLRFGNKVYYKIR